MVSSQTWHVVSTRYKVQGDKVQGDKVQSDKVQSVKYRLCVYAKRVTYNYYYEDI